MIIIADKENIIYNGKKDVEEKTIKSNKEVTFLLKREWLDRLFPI